MSAMGARSGKQRLVVPALGLLAAVALIAGLAYVAGVDPATVIAAMRRLPLWAWAAIVLAQAAIIFFAALKWRLVLAATAPSVASIGRGEATAATTLGTLAGQVLPIQLVTPLMRAWVARRRAIPVPVAMGTSALEQAFDVIVLVAMGGISALFLSVLTSRAGSPIMALLIAAGLVVALTCAARPVWRLTARIVGAGAGCSRGRARRALAALAGGLDAASALDSRTLALVTVLSALRFALLAALNIGVLHLLVPDVPLLTLTLAFPVVLFVNAVPIFPGGLGVAELTWGGALVVAGLSPAASVAAALALRILGTAGFLAAVPFLLAPLAGSPRSRPMVLV